MPLTLLDRAVTSSPLPLITTAEARMLRFDTASPLALRIRRGIYVNRADYKALPPWQKYAVRVHAFARLNPEAVLCLESAAVILGLPLFGEARDIHVYDPDRSSSRRFGDVCVHTGAHTRDIVRVNGVLVTSILDTTIDLSRVLPPASALALVDTSISPAQGGALTVPDLRAHALAQPGTRGAASMRWLWDQADPRAESPGESVSRAVIEWSGFPKPITQQTFHYDGYEDRADFFFEDSNAIGESDGWGKYRLDQDPDAAAALLRDEKLREDRLRRHGHPFARWDLNGTLAVKPLVDALIAASVRRIRPAARGALATLRDRRRRIS